jgi:hypothetical protein
MNRLAKKDKKYQQVDEFVSILKWRLSSSIKYPGQFVPG